MKRFFYLLAAATLVLATSCKKENVSPDSDYFTIDKKIFPVKNVAGYFSEGEVYDFAFSADPEETFTKVITSPKSVVQLDLPLEKLGQTLTVGEDIFNGESWDFYLFSFDANGTSYGSWDYHDLTSGYFSSSVTATDWTFEWDLFFCEHHVTGHISRPVPVKDFYLFND